MLSDSAHSSLKLSANRKLDGCFGFSGNAVAGCGTVSPSAHSAQGVSILRPPGALEDERTMNAAVGADDKTYTDLEVLTPSVQEQVGSGDGFGERCGSATRGCADMRNG